jgi:nitronate monooxygenase
MGRDAAVLEAVLGVELPVVQAPMAGAQGSALAVAVSEAGGLGSVPCAMLDADGVRAEVAAVRAETDRPFNLNFFCHAPPAPDAEREAAWRARLTPYYREFGLDPAAVSGGPGRLPFDAEMAGLVEELRPPVVSFHFGLPAAELVARVKASGATVMSSATTVAEARWLEANGADVIIAQGYEAGGHRGMFLTGDLSAQTGTFALVRQVGKAVDLPVVAAGGIADKEGVAAAFMLGAVGVQVGTAYLLCPEASTSEVARAALRSDDAHHTALTNVFTGRPARGIVNRAIRELGPISPMAPAFPTAATAIGPLRAAAEARGSPDFSPIWCGQNPGCADIPAAELTHDLAAR